MWYSFNQQFSGSQCNAFSEIAPKANNIKDNRTHSILK